MLYDLAGIEDDREAQADVAIIGAGIAGLFLATKLSAAGIRTIVVESGGETQEEDVHPLNEIEQLGQTYMGAAHGRFRCLGGTSTRWGGALIPFVDEDLRERAYLGLPAWPVQMEELRGYLSEIERIFGVDHGTYEVGILDSLPTKNELKPKISGDFLPRFAKWPTFRKRNVAILFNEQIRRGNKLEIWLHAHAVSASLDMSGSRLLEIVCCNEREKKLTVRAKHFAVCAGALETTRFLLQMDRECGGIFANEGDALGRYFHDHVSAPVARIYPKKIAALNKLAGHRFVGKTMRSVRFELSANTRKKERVGGAFSHIAFETKGPTGFDYLRELFRGIQKRERVDPKVIYGLMTNTPYLFNVGYWRYFRKQLYWPKNSEYWLHTVVEQIPRRKNRIVLSSEKDSHGRWLAGLDWRLDDSAANTIRVVRAQFCRYWKKMGFDDIGKLEWSKATEDLSGFISRAGDVYHPGGTTRMAGTKANGVVDGDLRTFALSNFWISSTSTFPAGGSANPTLTLILLTLRLGDRLKQELSNR